MAVINGTINNDNLVGTQEDDLINGNAGNDSLFGLVGRDNLDGGIGNDTLAGDPDGPPFFNIGTPIFGQRLIEVTIQAEVLYRVGQDNLNGGAGNDFLEGGAGQDTLKGGSGNDVLFGGYNAIEGDDTFFASPEAAERFFEFSQEYDRNGYGDDVIEGGSGNDTLLGDSIVIVRVSVLGGNDFIDGGSGNDRIDGGQGSDTLYGGSGNDVIIATTQRLFGESDREFLYGGSGNDTLEAGGNDDFLDGGAGNDSLDGDYVISRVGRDTILGGTGDDTLRGFGGSDVLEGGAGDDVLAGETDASGDFLANVVDTLTGGQGRDTFVLGDDVSSYVGIPYRASGTTDYALITDFNPTEDIIQLATDGGRFFGSFTYTLGSSPTGLPLGVGIFTTQMELIAIVQGVTNLSLDESYFTFV
jgi:Ca2+-binding RTX toxin-like protein